MIGVDAGRGCRRRRCSWYRRLLLGWLQSTASFCDGATVLRQAIGGLRAKLRRGDAQGGVVRGKEAIGVAIEHGGALLL
jgi:hypothetical protein